MARFHQLLSLFAAGSLLVLLADTLCFVTSTTSPSTLRTTQETALRGTPAAPLKGQAKEQDSSFAVLAPIGIALLGLAAIGRQQRPTLVQRHFFPGGNEPASPVSPTSYKDFTDPWRGSADFGFDPLNLAIGDTFDKGNAVVAETTYYNYRESEVKHGRFAMVAFLAIFGEAADRGAVLVQLGVRGASDDLDGTLGLDEVQAPLLFVGVGAQALAEYSKQSKENDGSFLSVEYNRERCPGDLGFDPLGVGTGNTRAQVVELHNGEVNLGRLAMIGLTVFLVREFIVKDL